MNFASHAEGRQMPLQVSESISWEGICWLEAGRLHVNASCERIVFVAHRSLDKRGAMGRHPVGEVDIETRVPAAS
eukprot:6810920-Pyramimonas_sp.AAC.1